MTILFPNIQTSYRESLLHVFGNWIDWIGMVGRVLFLWIYVLDGAWLCCAVVGGYVVLTEKMSVVLDLHLI